MDYLDFPTKQDLDVVSNYIQLAIDLLGKQFPFSFFKAKYFPVVLKYTEQEIEANSIMRYVFGVALTSSYTDFKNVYIDPFSVYDAFRATSKEQHNNLVHFDESSLVFDKEIGAKVISDKRVSSMLLKSALFVLMHEYFHIMLAHDVRENGRDHLHWNIACDSVINRLVQSTGVPVPTIFVPPWKTDATTEEVYDAIMKDNNAIRDLFGDSDFQNQSSSSNSNQSQSSKENSNQSQSSEGQSSQGQRSSGNSNSIPDSAKEKAEKIKKISEEIRKLGVPKEVADRLASDIVNKEEKQKEIEESGKDLEEIKRELAKDVAQIVAMAEAMKDSGERFKGDIASFLKRELDDLTKVSVPWYRRLQKFLKSFVYGTGGMYDRALLPVNKPNFRRPWTYKKEPVEVKDPVVIVVDTSGSMSDKEINTVANMLYSFVNSLLEFTRVVIISNDADVHTVKAIDVGHVSKLKLKRILEENLVGGGGTSFVPPFVYMEKNRIFPSAVLFFTDLYGDYPSEDDLGKRFYNFISSKTFWIRMGDGELPSEYIPSFGYVVDTGTGKIYDASKYRDMLER
ncbi:MAG: VWA-like domain-containing protein [Conexivisphaerales archaeon]